MVLERQFEREVSGIDQSRTHVSNVVEVDVNDEKIEDQNAPSSRSTAGMYTCLNLHPFDSFDSDSQIWSGARKVVVRSRHECSSFFEANPFDCLRGTTTRLVCLGRNGARRTRRHAAVPLRRGTVLDDDFVLGKNHRNITRLRGV